MLLFIGCIFSTSYAVDIISHPKVNKPSLTTSQLRRIYTMRQLQWPNGERITVYVLPRQHAIHLKFSKERLQMFPYQLDRIWNKLTYSGLGVAPIAVNSPEELLNAVKSTPGAIGYVDNIEGMEAVNVVQIKD